MNKLIKPIFIIAILIFSLDSMAQDNVKPESKLSNKIDSPKTKNVKQKKPVDALSSKSSSAKIVKKSVVKPLQKM